MAERLFTTYQIANLLGATPGAVMDWINRGWLEPSDLPGNQVRISESALVKFLADRGIDLTQLLKKVTSPDEQQEIETEAQLRKEAKPAQSDKPKDEIPPQTAPAEIPGFIDVEPIEIPQPELQGDNEQAQYSNADAVAQQIVDATIAQAITGQAEQIHFTLENEKLTLRVRTGGVMSDRPNFAQKLPPYLTKQIPLYLIKRATEKPASLATITTGQFEFESQPVKLSAIPRRNGISVILSLAKPSLSLADLKLSEDDAQWLEQTLAQQTGLVLVCSKIASDRKRITETLYALAKQDKKFCVSIDRQNADFLPDPPGKLTWANITRNIEAVNPAVMSIGEMRDPKTAYSAFELAHNDTLVIAGMKSPSAAEAITELFECGIEPWALAKTLLCIFDNSTLIKIDNTLRNQLKHKQTK